MDHSTPAEHPRHDTSLIAGHAAGDLADPERIRAEALLAACGACVDLHRDLIEIQAATRESPAPATRIRDFRLSEDQAARLQRGSWVRAILRPFAAARSSTRPLAAAFTSVGVAGLLLATFVPGLLGGAASAPVDRDLAVAADSSAGGAPASTSAPQAIPGENQPVAADASAVAPAIQVEPTGPRDPGLLSGMTLPPAATDRTGITTTAGGAKAGASEAADDTGASASSTREPAPSTNLALIASLGFLVVGLALFGLRFAARRVR
jgi:anti-sigma factor RsiW